MTAQPAQPQWSADGQWWWNGQSWEPRAPQPPQTLVGTLHNAGTDHGRHLAKEVRVLIGIGMVVALIVFIAMLVHAEHRVSGGNGACVDTAITVC